MGNEQSTLGGALAPAGFHVLRVRDGSPAHDAGLVPYFDFLVNVDETPLDSPGAGGDALTGALERAASSRGTVTLGVYSVRDHNVREVTVRPRAGWASAAAADSDSADAGLLGCSIRFCSAKDVEENVWHILNVQPNSPASAAGLQSDTDYVISSQTGVLYGAHEAFAELIQEHSGQPVSLSVYSSRTQSIRQVAIIPNRDWGGSGMLGCDVAYGGLHRIPGIASPPSSASAASAASGAAPLSSSIVVVAVVVCKPAPRSTSEDLAQRCQSPHE
ncbi:hypothetical protein GQ42DRAFT_181712 [Ramicandelaber brevisporus]|nr:hypothetical protein GQ42DRAFT_181712 [Ramicandelaber brevisporus]